MSDPTSSSRGRRRENPADPLTVEELLAHAGFLRGLAGRLVRDPDRADDVVQEVWLAAIRKPPTPERSGAAWLAGVLRHLAGKAVRSERRRAAREARAASRARTVAEDPADTVARLELSRFVVNAVLALDEPYRSTIVNRYLDGLSAREIARRRGVPVETVRTWIGRGVARLRTHLDERHGSDREAWRTLLLPFAPSWIGIGASLMSTTGKAVLVATVLALVSATAFLAGGTSGGDRAPPGPDPVRSPAAVAAAGTAQDATGIGDRTPPTPAAAVSVARSGTGGGQGSVAGRIRFRDGRVPETAWVVAERLVRQGDPIDDGPAHFETTAGPYGAFRLDKLPPGPYQIVVRAAAGGTGQAEVEVTDGGEPTAAEIALHQGAEVAVRVTDGAGRPVEGARIRIAQRHRAAEGETDAGGLFVLDGLAAGPVQITRSDAGARLVRVQALRLAKDEGIRIDLRDQGSVEGVLYGPGGETLGGAELVLSPPRTGPVQMDEVRVRADAAGRYRIPALEAGRFPIVIRATGASPWVAPAGALVLREGEHRLDDLQVGPGRLIGTVRAAGGRDLPAASQRMVRLEREGGPVLFAAVSSTGRYEARGLEAGRWHVQVMAVGGGGAERIIDLGPAGIAEGVDLDLAKEE